MSIKDNMSNVAAEQGKILLIIAKKEELHDAVEALGLGQIEKKQSGEPYFKNSTYHISFTHKGEIAVAAISAKDVGVDIENVTVPRNVERLSRLFHESEIPQSLYDFYKVWTAKEATGKMLGTGITSDLLKEKTLSVRYVEIGDYLIAVAGEGEIEVKGVL